MASALTDMLFVTLHFVSILRAQRSMARIEASQATSKNV